MLSKSTPLTQKTPIGEAEHCLSNYRGSLQMRVFNLFPRSLVLSCRHQAPYFMLCNIILDAKRYLHGGFRNVQAQHRPENDQAAPHR